MEGHEVAARGPALIGSTRPRGQSLRAVQQCSTVQCTALHCTAVLLHGFVNRWCCSIYEMNLQDYSNPPVLVSHPFGRETSLIQVTVIQVAFIQTPFIRTLFRKP
jgi:hypothetical protein